MSEKPAAQAAKGGNGAGKPLPVIPSGSYRLREYSTNTWNVALPSGATKADLSQPSLFSTAPNGVERFDVMWLCANDDSFIVEAICLEGSKQGCSVQILRVIDLPPRSVGTPGEGLPANYSITMGTHEEGWIVSRKNADGSRHVLGMSRDYQWKSYEDARTWLRSHAAVQQR